MNYDISSAENFIFQLLDQCKFFLSPGNLLDMKIEYSKNEILTLVFLYRKGETSMSEIADYIKSPLNTVTGIVSRLEKKDMLSRIHSNIDKRVVTVSLSDKGRHFIKDILKELNVYFKKILAALSPEEIASFLKIITKAVKALNDEVNSIDMTGIFDIPKNILKRLDIL